MKAREAIEVVQETVLVTGAGGFIGSNLVEDQLEKGRKVIALDVNLERLNHLKSDNNCKLVLGDVRDSTLLGSIVPGIDIVFHLASAHLEVSKPEPYFWEINVDAVKMLLQIANTHKVRRFVHCSSVGVYGALETMPANEETECHPDIVYEITKLEGERAVLRFFGKSSLSTVVLRPAWVYGPRCPRTLKLFKTIKKKRFFMVGKGDNLRHPVYISDMLQAFDLAATKEGVDGETFVIAAAEPVKLRELIEQIIQVQNMQFQPITIPLSLMTPTCVVVEGLFKVAGKEPPFSTRSLKFFTESSAFDISKAQRILGYKPSISLGDGLTKTYDYFREKNLL